METMAITIARLVINAEDRQTGNGKDMYIKTFVNTDFYAKYRAEADMILTAEGYEKCIVG